MTENRSKYDPNRKTVGGMYIDAQKQSAHEGSVEAGELTDNMLPGFVDDLNQTIIDGSIEFGGKPFYIMIHEKKDMAMPRAILRRLIKTLYRPYPEDDTIVFHVTPSTNTVLFCWCLPHWSEMDNMLANASLFEPEMIEQIRAWKRIDLYHFGFTKDEIGNWIANPHFKDKPLTSPKSSGFKMITPSA